MDYTGARYESLDRRVVVITGGASGIGAEMARAFAAQGAAVHLVDIAEDAGATLAATLPGTRFHRCDVRDIAALRATLAAIESPDVLINNASRDDRHAMTEIGPEQWREWLAVNLDHQFFASQAVAPRMAARGGAASLCSARSRGCAGARVWLPTRPRRQRSTA